MKCVLVAAAMAILCRAQPPAFEVASVKLNRSESARRGIDLPPGRLTVTSMTLKGLIEFAYGVRDIQISGGPPWLDSDRWDVSANAGPEASDDERKRMLQTLLADRFQLAIRRETKELPVYALVVAKSGLKMKANTGGSAPEMRFGVKIGLLAVSGQDVPISKLADYLFRQTGRIVIDRTGIKGGFDFKLEWTPDAAHMPALNGSRMEPDPNGASIFTAVQEQLGLKLESAKGPVEVLTIERAEKAAEN